MRNRSESSQVNSGWFRARANRSHPEGAELLLCVSTRRMALAVSPVDRQRKAPKGETKGAFVAGRRWGEAGPLKTSQNAGDAKNGTAGL
jgi:hypothetical protein